MTQRVLSCIQPSGELHLGNYFGAIANWVKLQEEPDKDCLFGIVDLHAMTTRFDPSILRQYTWEMARDLVACGLDPAKSTLFVQSMIPEHSELYWILGCFSSFGDLTRQVQFKEKSSQAADGFASAGLFTYPVLQAADILSYRADLVPVGKDQEQHLEMARGVAARFNRFAGTTIFPEPTVLSTETPKVQSLADPLKKMSKSLGARHYIGLFEDEGSIRAKIQAAVTDSGEVKHAQPMGPGVENLLNLLRACGRADLATEFEVEYAAGDRRYSPLKEAVADAVVSLTNGFRSRKKMLMGDHNRLREQYIEGSRAAQARARETLDLVKEACGLSAAPDLLAGPRIVGTSDAGFSLKPALSL